MVGHVARMEGRSSLKISTDERIGKRPLGKSRCRLERNISKDLAETDANTRNWIDSARDRDYWRMRH